MKKRRTLVSVLMIGIIMLSSAAAFGEPGNVDGSGGVNLTDVIMSLRVSAGLDPGASISGDANSNGKISLEEAIYGLQVVAGLRQSATPNTPLILPTQPFAQSDVSTSYNPQTGNVTFLSSESGYAIAPSVPFSSTTTAEQAARSYLSVQAQGAFFGLTDQSQELTAVKVKTTDEQRNIVRFQQKVNGIPIIGSEIVVQMDAAMNLMSISGELMSAVSIDTTPSITADAAAQTALAKIAEKYQKNVSELTASTPELRIYNPVI